MKKALPLIVVVLIAAGVFYFINSSTSIPSQTSSNPAKSGDSNSSGSIKPPHAVGGMSNTSAGSGDGSSTGDGSGSGNEDQENLDKKATEIYKSAEEALKAIQAGASDYDDRVLEQFTELGEDCSWCDEVYAELKKMISSAETSQDKRSYFAEMLAISGRVGNIASLIDAIKNAPSQETAEALSEALELTVGKNDVTQYLGDQLGSANDDLKESLIAAITNQGTRLAVDTLYKQTVAKGDPDGYYSLGIGLAELVPDESAMPYLQELLLKRDQYSHLAVKSLLNSGLDGLKLVMSSIANSPNPEFDTKMLKDAIDHVPFDDDTKAYLDGIVQNEKDPLKSKFAKDILESAKPDEGVEEDAAGVPVFNDKTGAIANEGAKQ